jgi:hypothetical protein
MTMNSSSYILSPSTVPAESEPKPSSSSTVPSGSVELPVPSPEPIHATEALTTSSTSPMTVQPNNSLEPSPVPPAVSPPPNRTTNPIQIVVGSSTMALQFSAVPSFAAPVGSGPGPVLPAETDRGCLPRAGSYRYSQRHGAVGDVAGTWHDWPANHGRRPPYGLCRSCRLATARPSRLSHRGRQSSAAPALWWRKEGCE